MNILINSEKFSLWLLCSFAERRARWGGDAIPAGFIRMSVGCEDAQDLLDDITQALTTVSTTKEKHL